MDCADFAIQRMGSQTTKDWSKRKMKLCHHLVMKELCEWYRDHQCDVDSVHSRMKDRSWSNSHGVNSASSISSAFRLCGGWFPFICTDVGMLFLQLAVLGQVHRWPDICRLMYQVATNSNMQEVQMMGERQRHTSPPSQNPMHNPCLKDPILQQLIQLLLEFELELDDRTKDSLSSSTTSSDSSASLLDSLDSFLLRELFQSKYSDHESHQSSGTDSSDLESYHHQ